MKSGAAKVRSVEQRISYRHADRRAEALATRTAFSTDRANARREEKRADEIHQWAQRVHASNRAAERYNVSLDARTLRELAARMYNGVASQPGMMLIGYPDEGRRNAIWLIWNGDAELPVVFDFDTKQIVTVLPPDGWQIQFDRRTKRFPALVNGGSKAARRYWFDVRS